MQPPPPLTAPTNGPRPAFARPLPPNMNSFSSPSSSPPSTPPLSSSPSSSPSPLHSSGSMQPRPLPSPARRQHSFSSSPSPSSPAPSPPSPSPLALSSSGSSSTAPAVAHKAPARPPPLQRVPSADLPATPSPSSPSASSAAVLSPRPGGSVIVAGKSAVASPRRPVGSPSPRGPLPPMPPNSGGVPSPSSSEGLAPVPSPPPSRTSPREPLSTGTEAKSPRPDDSQEWPATGSQRHQPPVAPSLVAPFTPPASAGGLASSASSAAAPSPSSGDGSGADEAVSRDDELLRVLTTGEGRVMMVLLNALEFSDMDKITRAAVEYFVAAEPNDPNHPLLLRVLNTLLLAEISETEDPTTLFRSNTNGSKMLSACLRICGTSYLKNAIGPTIARVCRDTPAVEIDPQRASSPEEAQANVANLYALCEAFLGSILSSLDSCPVFIRRIFAHLQEAVTARFPDNKQITANYSIVGGFIFLRFFCSAIFSPFGFGVAAEQPKQDAMRAFVLVSKVLQMIANGLSFSDKTSEEYMRALNSFLEKYQGDVVAFFRAVATVPPEGTGDNDGLGVEAAATALAAADTLHAALHKYSAALASVLSKDERDHACGVALAGFLAAFPPPGRAPASGAAVPKSPNTSPTVAERTQDPVVKKKGGLGGFSAAGKRATTIMSTLRGHDKDKLKDKEKEKEEKREREREKEREKEEKKDHQQQQQQQQQREREEGHHDTPAVLAPTLLSARRKEEGSTLHDLKALLVQLRDIKKSVETEIAVVEQQILDIISGQTPAESVALSPTTLALLAAAKPQLPATTAAAVTAEAQRKENKKAEKERERKEKEEKERQKKEQKEKEKEEKKEERRSRRLSMDATSGSKLRRPVNPDDLKDFAKFSESFGNTKFGGGRLSGNRGSGGLSGKGSRSGSGSGSDIVRPAVAAAADYDGLVTGDAAASIAAPAVDSPLKSVSAPALEQQQQAAQGMHTEEEAVSFYAAGEKRGHRASLAVSSLSHLDKRSALQATSSLDSSGSGGGGDSSLHREIAEKASLPSSGLVKDRKVKLRTHKNCFLGSEFVDWLVVSRRVKLRAEAVALGEQMFLQKIIVPIQSSDTTFEDKKALYRFFGGEGGFSPVSSPVAAPPNPFPDEEGDEELDKVYPYMVTEIEVKNRKDFESKTHKNCFVATQAVDWLMKNRHQPMTHDQALEFAEKMRQKGYIKWVGRKTKTLSISGPMMSVQATAASLAAGPPFEDDDSYYIFEKKNKNRASKRTK